MVLSFFLFSRLCRARGLRMAGHSRDLQEYLGGDFRVGLGGGFRLLGGLGGLGGFGDFLCFLGGGSNWIGRGIGMSKAW